jgi:hypothetical protein
MEKISGANCFNKSVGQNGVKKNAEAQRTQRGAEKFLWTLRDSASSTPLRFVPGARPSGRFNVRKSTTWKNRAAGWFGC